MKTVAKSCVLAVFLIFMSASMVMSETIRVATTEYPPFLYKDRDGMAQELMRAAFHAVGLDVEYNVFPLKRVKLLFDSGQYDYILFASEVFDDENVTRKVDVFKVLSVLVYKKERFGKLHASDLDRLKGKRVGILAGDEQYAQMLRDLGFNPIPHHLLVSNLKKLDRNRLEFVDTTDLTAVQLLEKVFGKRQHEFNMLTYTPPAEVGLIYKRGAETNGVAEQFLTGVKLIQKNGIYMKILEKYYGVGKVPKEILTLH